jgi:hypothetical protein
MAPKKEGRGGRSKKERKGGGDAPLLYQKIKEKRSAIYIKLVHATSNKKRANKVKKGVTRVYGEVQRRDKVLPFVAHTHTIKRSGDSHKSRLSFLSCYSSQFRLLTRQKKSGKKLTSTLSGQRPKDVMIKAENAENQNTHTYRKGKKNSNGNANVFFSKERGAPMFGQTRE